MNGMGRERRGKTGWQEVQDEGAGRNAASSTFVDGRLGSPIACASVGGQGC